MRAEPNLVKQVRDILKDLDELKDRQFIGTDQIVSKLAQTNATYDLRFAVTYPFQSLGSSIKIIQLDVEAVEPKEDRFLLTQPIPEVRLSDGTLVLNWDNAAGDMSYDTTVGIAQIDLENANKNTYLIIIIAPTNTVMTLKMRVTSLSEIKFKLTEAI